DPKSGLLGAAQLTPGTVSDQFLAPDEFHWFRFHATKDSRYTFQTTLETVSQVALGLFDADGNHMWVWNAGYADPTGAFRWVAPQSGDFYVEVGGYSAGSYELTMIE